MKENFFTSESVTCGHPDKICDRISDAILDAIIEKDRAGRVALECICTTGFVMLFGEVTTNCYVDMPKIARRVIYDIGYKDSRFMFDSKSCAVICNIDEQSKDIEKGILKQDEEELDSLKAGDQGILFGYACDETKEFMPLPIVIANKMARKLEMVRKNSVLDYLGPDGKIQVTVRYVDGVAVDLDTVVVSTQHKDEVDLDVLRKDILENVIFTSVPENLISKKTKFLINPCGKFVLGGPVADSGLTGRKLMVDTYGGFARHGGGAFSGKDPTKLDRSGAYFARYIAKNIVCASLAKRCEVQIGYAIGVCRPVSIYINTFGTGVFDDFVLKKAVEEVFDFRPAAIIKKLDLQKPIYEKLSNYGHFGRDDLDVLWEKTDMVYKLKEILHNCHVF